MRRPSLDVADPLRNLEESRAPSSDPRQDDTDNDGSVPMDTDGPDIDLTMPPTEDDVREQDSRIFTPPPRIAARFYRPSQARRRDTAASSRRNSISSAHSRCSSTFQGSSRAEDQSKHVAQHLRRATFLEDRRARLADRAAHAEKVRLRAAVAKAATRDTSHSEERALAAQQARERKLAEIVANCAEEVKKAKQVAEFMKEKREQELAKMKTQLEERQAEAEKRRGERLKQNARGRARGQSFVARKPAEAASSPVKEQEKRRKMSPEVAAARIAGWWRGCSRKRVMREFNNLGLTVDGIRDTSFDTVTELLAQERVLVITARLLRICGLQEAEPGSVGEMAAVRSFLSAFLILGHPNQVLANKTESEAESQQGPLASHRLPAVDLENPQLQDLVGKAKDLLITFENILVRLTSANRYTIPPALTKTLPEAYAVFHNAFIAWKSRDSNALIEVMLMQFVELDAIFQTVKDATDDAAAQLYRQSIQDSQLMLIVRIKKLAGQEKGKKLIFDAVSEARKARKAKKKKTQDTRPRVAETNPGEASATASTLVPDDSRTLTPPPTPASKQVSKPTIIKPGLNDLLPDNRIITHELAINKEYQLPSEEYQELQAALSRPMFEHMKANLDGSDTQADFRFFMAMASQIKSKLQKLLKEGNSMYNLIGEILDPELAERQYTLGNFSYERFFTAMGSLLPKLCAPFRDDEVKELVENKLSDGNLIDRVEALDGFINLMLCDYINYMLRVAAPSLIESAAQYEAKRFAQDIESGRVGLGAAEAAWKSARSKVLAEVQKRDPEGVGHPKSRPTVAHIYAQMVVDVFTQPMPAKWDTVPEMLRLDQKRIGEVSTMVQRIITVGAVLLQCKNLLKRDVRSPWRLEASRVMMVLEEEYDSIDTTVQGTMAALEASRSMPAATKTHLRALVTKVLTASKAMSEEGSEPGEPVLRLLLTRLRGNILARLAPGSATQKVKAANTAGEKLASLGLSEFVDKVRQISDLLDKIGSVDREAHSPWWDAIATKVEQEDSA
ncbi:T-complex protein-like protein-like protein [Hapsidospora chrysogenum ATCC 11550]|uniref:T-complex protein-like protein-like protein n=1 Tax=Hapsidospora chrysogenum (strain ATCC 11550 / CBS 779.69 / DSM 880 / IAM 14645 / JCM 23072 / IMI 49137) TaxID=857340 RepID=A0A086TGC4_HAPC1|nr:T-complex protein-like protein-like protein [Hapsidospora chrysogenum ATCC 11550]